MPQQHTKYLKNNFLPLWFKLLISLLCLMTLLVTKMDIANAKPIEGIEIDAQVTAQAPWTAGEKVDGSDTYANLMRLGRHDVYRVFLGVTPQGYYVVQDFYADNDQKLTDPYQVRTEQDVRNEKYLYGEQSIEGMLRVWYPSGEKYFEVLMVNGKREGVWKIWSRNGALIGESFYVNGEREGTDIDWSDEGIMTRHCNFKAGRRDGLCTQWYENGNKSEEATYRDGQPIGLESWWHDNGQLQTQGQRGENGKMQGEWLDWDRDGNLTRRTWYEDSKIITDEVFDDKK